MAVKNAKSSVVEEVIKEKPIEEVKAPEFEAAPAIVENHIQKMRREESRMVKGIFQDVEKAGGVVSFPFHKYPGDGYEMYTLRDGCEYELPLAVVRHLNSECYYSKDAYCNDLVSPDGKPMKNPNPKKEHRFSFKVSEYN